MTSVHRAGFLPTTAHHQASFQCYFNLVTRDEQKLLLQTNDYIHILALIPSKVK